MRQECANAVNAAGGTYFIYGKHKKKGWCFKESTTSAQCTEGWETDSYGFYAVRLGGGCMRPPFLIPS